MDIARSHYQSVPDYGSWYRLICNGEQTAQAKMVHYDVIKYYINSNIQNPKAPTTMLKIRPFVSFRKIFRHAAWKKHENESMNLTSLLICLFFFCKRMDISFQQHESLIAISVLRLQHYSSGTDQGKSAGGAHQPTRPKPPHPASLGWSAVFWYN